MRNILLATLVVAGLTTSVQADSVLFMDNSGGGGVLYDVAMNNSDLSAPFDTRSFGDGGRIQWSGNGYMKMDSSTYGGYALNEADVQLSLDGYTNVTLEFNHRSWGDEVDGFSSSPSFTDSSGEHYNADGVMVSENGVNWVSIWTPDVNESTSYQYSVAAFNIVDAAAAAGLTLTSTFHLRFQQYDNYPITSSTGKDGRGWDWITVHGTPDSPNPGPTAAVPEPSSLALLGIGLAGLAGYRLRRKRRKTI